MIFIPMANNGPVVPNEGLLYWHDYYSPNTIVSGSTIARPLNPLTGVTGSLLNGANFEVASGSVYFPSTSGNSIVPNNFNPALGNFHAVAIYKCLSTTATGNYQRILDKSFSNGFWMGRNGTTSNSWGGGVRQTASPFGIYATFNDLEWQMIGLSRTGTSIKLWNKGTVVNSQTGNGTATDTTNLRLGRDPVVAYGLGGYINAVLIYNRELSPAEMTQIYQYYQPRFNF